MQAITNDTNVKVYTLAVNYIQSLAEERGIDIEKYYIVDEHVCENLTDIYIQFISSAQNYQRMPKVINFNGRKDEIQQILFDFDYKQIRGLDTEELYQTLRNRFDAGGADNKFNSWHKWSRSVVDSAKFLCDFKDADDFKEFVKCFDYNVSTRMALPLLISEKISGIGFALACDLLKELGFTDYPKPDVHLIEIFSALGLSEDDPISTFEAIVRMSDICEEVDPTATPFKVDKVFWLIGSGRFHKETPEITIGRHKEEFIQMAKRELDIA